MINRNLTQEALTQTTKVSISHRTKQCETLIFVVFFLSGISRADFDSLHHSILKF